MNYITGTLWAAHEQLVVIHDGTRLQGFVVPPLPEEGFALQNAIWNVWQLFGVGRPVCAWTDSIMLVELRGAALPTYRVDTVARQGRFRFRGDCAVCSIVVRDFDSSEGNLWYRVGQGITQFGKWQGDDDPRIGDVIRIVEVLGTDHNWLYPVSSDVDSKDLCRFIAIEELGAEMQAVLELTEVSALKPAVELKKRLDDLLSVRPRVQTRRNRPLNHQNPVCPEPISMQWNAQTQDFEQVSRQYTDSVHGNWVDAFANPF